MGTAAVPGWTGTVRPSVWFTNDLEDDDEEPVD